MTSSPRLSLWPRMYRVATSTLVIYFGLLALVHLVLTVLFWLGVRDTGVGYVLDFELPAWLITLLDASAAYLLRAGYRSGDSDPFLGLAMTVVASLIMLGRASWFVLVPVLVMLTLSGSIGRVVRSRVQSVGPG